MENEASRKELLAMRRRHDHFGGSKLSLVAIANFHKMELYETRDVTWVGDIVQGLSASSIDAVIIAPGEPSNGMRAELEKLFPPSPLNRFFKTE